MPLAGTEPFRFYTEHRLIQLLGLRASNLAELHRLLIEVPGACIFYHTHHLFLSHHFEKPVVYNDFANWVDEALQEEALGERLAAIDLMRYTTIRDLREDIISTIHQHMQEPGWTERRCPPGDEFYFAKSRSFPMPLGLEAHDPEQFFRTIPNITPASIYFHFLEARLRLGRQTNDFSAWMESQNRNDLAAAIDRLDPYTLTLQELRDEITEVGHRYGIA